MKSEIPTAICFGEILWDVLPDGPQPGGAPLNVAYHLTKQGVDTALISRVGEDENGRKLIQLMEDWGINNTLVQSDEHHATSQVLARMGNGNEVSYEIVFPVAWDFISRENAVSQKANACDYFIYGSLASRNDASRDTLLGLLETPAIKVFDINLRAPFINRGLLEILLTKADIVKFNESELDIVQVMFNGSFESEASKIRFIMDRFEVDQIIVTKGEFGASYYKAEEAHHVWGNEIKVADTIGSGDSFLAAFIANHCKGLHPIEIVKNSVAMGGFIATKKGGCPQYELIAYQEFRNQLFKP